jgi:SAM-dependent methyltransferase
MHIGKLLYDKNDTKVIDCEFCGFAHLYPFPSEEKLNKIYSEDYYVKEKPNYISNYLRDSEWWNEVYKYRLSLLERYGNGLDKQLCDIGSGPGLLLKIAQENGWNAFGYEPNFDAWNYSIESGLNVRNEFFLGQESAMNFVYLGEVLEHLSDPAHFLKLISKSMRKTGLLGIVVPNDFNIIQRLLTDGMKFEEWFVAAPYHINYFNYNSLRTLLNKCNFEIVHSETTFCIDMMLLLGENYLTDSDLGRKWHERRMKWETDILSTNPKLYEEFYTNIAKVGLGRELFVIAKVI